jgi:exonuclease III
MASNPPPKPTIVFWNSRGLRRHLTNGALQSLMDPTLTPHPPSIVALVETHWSDQAPTQRALSSLPTLPNYSWVHRHHTNRSGGIAILLHDSIACLPMTSLNNRSNPLSTIAASASAVLWHTIRFPNTPPFLLGVGYLSPSDVANNNLATEAMCKSLQLAAAEGLPLVLVGDFNLRHPDWLDFNAGGNTTPPQVLASYISTSSLTVLQRPTPGRVHGHGSLSLSGLRSLPSDDDHGPQTTTTTGP